MANAAWPGTLPAYVLEDGYQETLPKQAIESAMDAGPPKQRRRFTTNWRQYQCVMKMDPSQTATFETFYSTTLAGGTLPFDWVHPVTRASTTFRFRAGSPPEYGVEGGTRRVVKFAIESLG